jgi:thioredoxin 1
MQNLAQVTDATFRREILEAAVPVLVDFWAPWCAYCKAMAPVVEQVATEFGARLKVVGVNAEEHGTVAAHFGVRGLPTFLVVKAGQVAEQVVGAVPKAKLRAAVERALAG